MRARISLPISSWTTAPFLTVYWQSCDGVQDAQGVLGDDHGVFSNDEIVRRSRGGVMTSVPPPQQQQLPPPSEDL